MEDGQSDASIANDADSKSADAASDDNVDLEEDAGTDAMGDLQSSRGSDSSSSSNSSSSISSMSSFSSIDMEHGRDADSASGLAVDSGESGVEDVVLRRPGRSEVVQQIPGVGELRYNEDGFIRAHCPVHGKECRKQRATTVNASRPGQGRPLGLLVSWLQKARSAASASEHKKMPVCSLEDRRLARAFLYGVQGGRPFANEYEHGKAADGEPERIP